jgi:hypothetical protein
MFYATNTLQQIISNTTQADRNPSDVEIQSARPAPAAQRLSSTKRCSEPGGSVAVAIVASRAPGR